MNVKPIIFGCTHGLCYCHFCSYYCHHWTNMYFGCTYGKSRTVLYLCFHDHPTLPIKTCILKNFGKKAIAIGRMNTDALSNDEAYNIIVDEIFDGNELLFDRDGNFDDITVEEIINWPKYSVQFVMFNFFFPSYIVVKRVS
ncbi:hypothetical protein M6B38_372085 [Iris pallida]|uniref:Uncharacterized protein n=1 Tax=Iris pallida TaxID=29817 RepID=A0AAX6GE19_IRIPA|nr:hypothetical protein M6B38_372085 [Iris pallida]